jgi:signal transduction histidine kinase
VFELTVITGPDKGQVYRSLLDETVIGREDHLEVTLNDRSASRHHARVIRRGRAYEIEDLGSGNGTLVNSERITTPKPLLEGDLISIGKNTLRFHQAEEHRPLPSEQGEYRTSATITMRDLQRELGEQRAGTTEWDELQRARQDIAAVFRVSQALNGMQSPDELYAKIIDIVLSEFPRADRCTLLLSENESEDPSVQISQARKNSIRITDTLYRRSLAHTALQQQQAMLIRDPVNDERLSDRDTAITENIRSAICVPLQTQVGLRGVIYADCVTDSAGFIEPDLKLLSVIGLQAAAAIDNARLFEKLNQEKSALAEANAKIKLAQQRLVQSEKLAGVGQLAAGIVHDIRNPIQLILGHAQFLLGTLRDHDLAVCNKQEFVEGLGEVERGVAHINEIISQLLAFARQSKPELRAANLNDVAVDTMRFLTPETNRGHVRVVTHYDPVTPPVLADVNQLKQVIINIVINAVQAMPQGGTLTVSTAMLRDDGREMVSLALADTGCGMTADQVGRIFDPFFTTKTPGQAAGGTGLGLSVSYGIVENHGGRILVDSEPGKGSCFTILLPAHIAPAQQSGDPRATFHG